MNDGKICVSVCAENAEEFQKKISEAAEFADVIELRFDCLNENVFNPTDVNETQKFLQKIFQNNFGKIFLSTFRPKEQGGKRNLTKEERDYFWSSGFDGDWADLEEDIVEDSFYWLWDTRICSYHNFETVPENLNQIYERLKSAETDVIKIAVQADDITDAIPVWKLLEKAKSENKKIVPIAMGEAGKWTRILGLAHGAFLTYASLETGGETAPGQISARDLIETYRVKELNEQTEIYGVLGGNTSYSQSPYMQNAAFKSADLNAVFLPLQVKNLDEFIRRMVRAETREIDLNFKGFSVTIPHKQAIVKHLDFVDEAAREIGAVNTVKIIDGKLYGYNTDAHGFIEPLKNSYGDLRGAKAAILGAGGAARACVYALKKDGARVTVFARDLEKAANLTNQFQINLSQLPNTNRQLQDFDIIVNTTPLGTKGELENETIVTAEQLAGVNLVYDLVYNPFQTRLMAEADKVNVPKIGGMAMLVAQGAKQFEIWTGKTAPVKEMSAAILKRLS